ncbi:hypothetical protein C8R47DRAFT_914036, partial [Mycena vitilis]
GDIIEPLFSFAKLSHSVGFDLDDAAVLRMARAWPRIHDLVLKAGPSRHMSSRVTLEGLCAFTKHCPSLCVLALSFDATVVPKIRFTGRKRKSQQKLFSLHVALSPIRRPRAVAKLFAAIFPRLA